MNADKKLGHRRQISKQLIKRQLLEDLYPIPRQHRKSSRHRLKTDGSNKWMNTLQFLDFNSIEVTMLTKFQQKFKEQLQISNLMVQCLFRQLHVDPKLQILVKKLVNVKLQGNSYDQDLIFQLKGLISTASIQIQQVIKVLFFYHIIRINQDQYRTIIRRFQQNHILQQIQSLQYLGSQLLTAKISSLLSMIIIKFNERKIFAQIGETTVLLRRKVEERYFGFDGLKVDLQYARLTFFFSLKCLQLQIQQNNNPFEMMLRIQSEIELSVTYEKQHLITKDVLDIFLNELGKIKKIVSSKVEHDYYHTPSKELPLAINSYTRTKSALRQFKRRRSCTKINQYTNSLPIDSVMNSLSPSQIKMQLQMPEKLKNRSLSNFKQIYSSKSNMINKSNKAKVQSKLRKVRKQIKKSYLQTSVVNTLNQFSKDQVVNYSKSLKLNNVDLITIGKQKREGCSSLLMKFDGIKLLGNAQKKGRVVTGKQKAQKRMKIQQIYSSFSNQNKIVRDIPFFKLQSELSQIRILSLGSKQVVREMLSLQLINFSAGLENRNNQFNMILNNKGCLSLHFLKIWLNQLKIIEIELQMIQSDFILKVLLNGKLSRIVLHQGNNMLCQRYVTIWPTIRYLIHKKMMQFYLFKKHQLLLTRKMQQISLIALESDFYHDKFGYISKEQIQQINICLDNLFKLLLILEQYSLSSQTSHRIDISHEHKYKLSESLGSTFDFKLILFAQICINQIINLSLCQILVLANSSFYSVKVMINRESLLTTINNRAELKLMLELVDVSTGHSENKTNVCLQWSDLADSLITYQKFVELAIYLCAKVKFCKKIMGRIVNYLIQRIKIKQGSIFNKQLQFQGIPKNKQFDKIYLLNTDNSSNLIRYQLDIVQNYGGISEVKLLPDFVSNNIQWKALRSKIKGVLPIIFLNKKKKDSIQKENQINNLQQQNIQTNYVKQLIDKRTMTQTPTILAKGRIIWEQQLRVRSKTFLCSLRISEQGIDEEWVAQYTLINRNNQVRHKLSLNHLDLQCIYYQKDSNSDRQVNQKSINQTVVDQKQELLIMLVNCLDFYQNHHISRLSVNVGNYSYLHCFKNNHKLQHYQNIHFTDKRPHRSYRHPRLEPLLKDNKIRIVKVVKIGKQWAFLTIKRQLFNQISFWQIILQFPRRHTHYAFQISQQDFSFILSDFRKANNKRSQYRQSNQLNNITQNSNFKPSKNNIFYSLQAFQAPLPDNLSISIDCSHNQQQLLYNKMGNIDESNEFEYVTYSKHQQCINYPKRIIGLFQRKEVQVSNNKERYYLNFGGEQSVLRERIIQQFDRDKDILYNVWLDGQIIEVTMYTNTADINESFNSENDSLFLKVYRKQLLSRIQLQAASRFYEMENKDTNEQDFYLSRVCKFFFQYCKHQRIKYEN